MIELRIDKEMSSALLNPELNPRWPSISTAVEFIVSRLKTKEAANLVFVCTHNSRRSQFAHVWAEVFANSFGLKNVRCHSAGTEITACNERTIAALQRVGFEIVGEGESNPDFTCCYSDQYAPVVLFSSLLDDVGTDDFAAVMCCSDVDQRCPHVAGATVRIPLHYRDPKVSDDTDEESQTYDDRCREIGGDMMLLMSRVANQLDS